MEKKPFTNGPLTQARLKELFSYDSQTGIFKRLVNVGPAKAGVYKSRPNSTGYFRVCIDGRSYLLHRLAWLYTHGEWPVMLLDHIDGDTKNNKLANLRSCTHLENSQNTSKKARCRSGFRGVYGPTSAGRWTASIGINYKQIRLGTFDTKEQAHAAYLEAKKTLHSFQPNFTR